MEREKTFEELKAENEELRKVLSQVCKAYEILKNAMEACPADINESGNGATVESAADVKKLLEKYSRL